MSTAAVSVVDLLEVPLQTLRADTVVPFPLYNVVGDSPLLFRKDGELFLERQSQEARAMGLNNLYTPHECLGAYLGYLQDTLESIVDDPNMTPERKMSSAYDSGVVATEHVLADPSSDRAMASARQFVKVCLLLFEKHTYTFSGLVKVMDQTPTLSGHSVNVCLYGLLLGRAAGYTKLHELGLALLLHDIGMLAIPQEIHAKTELDGTDWKNVKKHPAFGIKRTQCATKLSLVARDVIQNHHERLDGSGYPRALSGSNLSVAVRIAAIVNAFDSRTTVRHYRDKQSAFEVLQKMLTEEKDGYDPGLLTIFVQLLST